MSAKWTRLVMRGRSQVIPALCPNCLRPANSPFRYGYKGLAGWLTNTIYSQTFAYCAECRAQAVSAAGLRRWKIVVSLLGFFFWIPIMVGFTDFARSKETGLPTAMNGTLAMAASVVVAVGLGVLFCLGVGWVKRRRHPRRGARQCGGWRRSTRGARTWASILPMRSTRRPGGNGSSPWPWPTRSRWRMRPAMS